MTKNEEAAAFAEAKRLVDRDWALLEALDIHVEKGEEDVALKLQKLARIENGLANAESVEIAEMAS